MQLLCRIAGAALHDLVGCSLRIEDETGGVVAAGAFSTSEDGTDAFAAFEVTAPLRAGSHQWRVFMGSSVAAPVDGASLGVISLTVCPQETHITVWDVPSTLLAGQTFAVKVGVKASVAGSLAGTLVTIHDADGGQLSAAEASDATLPGSDGLHLVELQLSAPASEGLHSWEARASGAASPASRTDASVAFAVRVVPRPDVSLTIEALDAEDGTPIRNARVVLHPYRALTDADGVAVLRIASGNYTLFVSARGHESASWSLAVTQDTAWRALLVREPPEDLSRGYV